MSSASRKSPEPSNKLPPQLQEWFRHDQEMSALTHDGMVHNLWRHAADGETQLFFVIDTPTRWETTSPSWHDVVLGELSPDNCDPPGSGPKKSVVPAESNTYGCRVRIAPLSHKSPEQSRQAILDGIRKAQRIADVFAFLAVQPVRLYAARRLGASWDGPLGSREPDPGRGATNFLFPLPTVDESIGTIVNDQWVRGAMRPLLNALTLVPDEAVRAIIEHSISWHAQANTLRGLGQYVHYWASIELLAAFFYEYLDPAYSGRKHPASVQFELLRHLLNVTGDNYTEKISKCIQLLNPSSRTKIQTLSKLVLPKDSHLGKVLFEKPAGKKGKPVPGARSMYDIRNDIAHGNVSPLLRQYLDDHADLLQQFRRASFRFILAVLESSEALCKHRIANYKPSVTPGEGED